MKSDKPKILFATRAIESPPHEGGYVLLKDISLSLKDSKNLEPHFFSATKGPQDISTAKVFSKTGWSRASKRQLMLGLAKHSHKYDLVHTAHIPTKLNVTMIKSATSRARRSGTKFVQTVTGLPDVSMTPKLLKNLLWGDYIVCQSPNVYDKAKTVHENVTLITPWASVERIKYNKKRREETRKKLFPNFKKIVVFPGEFDRLGVDESFSKAIEVLLKNSDDCLMVLACRFDKQKTGEKIAAKFPGKVMSLGNTENIVELLEAADLVIYPVNTMDSKFNPPLVIVEALQLHARVLISDLVGLGGDSSNLLSILPSGSSWAQVGKKIARIVNVDQNEKTTNSGSFNSLLSSYQEIYKELLKRS